MSVTDCVIVEAGDSAGDTVALGDGEALGSAAITVPHAKARSAQQIVLEIIVYDCTNFRERT